MQNAFMLFASMDNRTSMQGTALFTDKYEFISAATRM